MKSLFIILIIAAVAAAWHYLPASHHRAATGIYFLRQYISFNTSDGVTGWPPGQEIHEVLKAPFVAGSRTVSDGKLIAIVPEAMLSQDIEDAEAMRLADNDSQAQARSDVAALKAHAYTQERTAQIVSAQNINRANAVQVAASTVGAYNTRLNDPAGYVGSGSPVVVYGSAPYGYSAPSSTNTTYNVVASFGGSQRNPAAPASATPVLPGHIEKAPKPTPFPSGSAR